MNSIWISLLLLKRTLSSRRTVLTGIVLPVVLLLALSFTGGKQKSSVSVPYLNQDRGQLGATLLGTAGRDITSLRFEPVQGGQTPWLVLPDDFTEAVLSGSGGHAFIQDSPASLLPASAEAYFNGRIGQLSQRADALRSSGLSGSRLEEALVQDAALEQPDPLKTETVGHPIDPLFRTAAGIAIIAMMMFVSGTVTHIVDDRGRYTMLRIFTSPLRRAEIVFGYVFGSLLAGTIQVTALLLVLQFSFHTRLQSIGEIGLVLECLLLAVIGLSCLLGSIAGGSQGLSGLFSVVIIPTSMLGGCFWPVDMMPSYLQKLAAFVPQYWALDAWMRAASGGSLKEDADPILLLLLFAMVLISLGITFFRPGNDSGKAA